MDMCVDLWAWTGRGPCPEPPAGFVAWVAEDPSWARDRAPNDLVLRAAVASAGGVALRGAWAFAGAIRGRAILEYRPAGPAPALATGADPGLLPAAAFLLDRASEVAATGVPWWTAWRQAAAALCETYEGCGFELAWTDGAVVLVLVQRLALRLDPGGVLAPSAAAGTGDLARGRAELARLGLYAGGRCLAVAPITGGA